jgi:hypothetical protein
MMKSARMLGTTAVLVAVPLAWGVAQTQSPAPPQTNPPPSVVKPETNTPQAQKEVMPQTGSSQSKTAATASSLIGLPALSSDGTKLGNILSVKASADGKVSAIVLRTGGFLGFGGHMVAIPEGKFTRMGDTVQVSMTADDVSKLPATTE